jgi:hypothetical protein
MSTQPNVKDFFDPKTNTFSYVVSDPGTKQCEPYRVCRRVNILRDYPDDKIKIYP